MADRPQIEPAENLLRNNCRHAHETKPVQCQNIHKRGIKEFANEARPHSDGIKPFFEPDSFCATFYGWPWIDRFMTVWKSCGFRPVSHLVWKKSHCSYEGYTQGFHEVGYLLAKGRPPKPENPPPDVLPWEYTGNKLHTNEKPAIAITPFIESFSKPGAIVLDPFCGSGTTGVAAKMCSRQFVLIEGSLGSLPDGGRTVGIVSWPITKLSRFVSGEPFISS